MHEDFPVTYRPACDMEVCVFYCVRQKAQRRLTASNGHNEDRTRMNEINLTPDLMRSTINCLPNQLLSLYATDAAFVTTSASLSQAQICLDGDVGHLLPCPEAAVLEQRRSDSGVYSLTLTTRRITPGLAEEAANGFENDRAIVSEILRLADGGHFVCYVVTHFNFWPAAEQTVFIGGDCYRTGPEIKDLDSIFGRTRDLAHAMLRKAVMIFPDIPVLHGGKKGEWIVIDRNGNKVQGISEDAIVALGTVVIPQGIGFLNALKEGGAAARGIYARFPDLNVMRPDTASPDVVSGPNWDRMCEAWRRRGVPLEYVTCLPAVLGGPRKPSSYPTAHGVVAAALALRDAKLVDKPLAETRFLLEALGGVGSYSVAMLIEKGVKPENIYAFDINEERCAAARALGINVKRATNHDYYLSLHGGERFDIWINNGEGDNTTPEHVARLLDAGVRVFCGAANNFLQEATKRSSLGLIFDRGAWAWPDEATSGGGWTLAVIDVMTRARGLDPGSEETEALILDTIGLRNESLVRDVLAKAGQDAEGAEIWRKVEEIIDGRELATLNSLMLPKEIALMADVSGWDLK